jgi:hypothetical protein
MSFDSAAPTVTVFSHPNHELAIFGLLQQVRPVLVYLTDGGGEDRVEQTRQGLRRIGLLDRAHFLGYTEQSFYDALLDADSLFYEGVATRLRGILDSLRPAQVLCDAVEYYNPVHDLSLPIVRSALRGLPETSLFEIPLVYETAASTETYEVQRPAASRSGQAIEFAIDDTELEAKVSARDEVYSILTAQLPLIHKVPRTHLSREVILNARPTVDRPEASQVLRYERRAKLLLERGEIERMITYGDHYLPVASSLLAN